MLFDWLVIYLCLGVGWIGLVGLCCCICFFVLVFVPGLALLWICVVFGCCWVGCGFSLVCGALVGGFVCIGVCLIVLLY